MGAREQERIWQHVLDSLAARFGTTGQVEVTRDCVDPELQWSQVKNVWRNAAVRSLLYNVAAPVRYARAKLRRSR